VQATACMGGGGWDSVWHAVMLFTKRPSISRRNFQLGERLACALRRGGCGIRHCPDQIVEEELSPRQLEAGRAGSSLIAWSACLSQSVPVAPGNKAAVVCLHGAATMEHGDGQLFFAGKCVNGAKIRGSPGSQGHRQSCRLHARCQFHSLGRSGWKGPQYSSALQKQVGWVVG